MSTSPLNPAQHVERIREIIMGRDLNQVHGRLERIESGMAGSGPSLSSAAVSDMQQKIASLHEECHGLRLELHQEKIMRKQQLAMIDQHLSQLANHPEVSGNTRDAEDLASEMAARIDARFREILTHLQSELLQWKGQLDRDVQALRDVKIDRKELMSRFARMASAAMEDEDGPSPKDGYLL
ncbi:MAG: hypothetical protein ACSHYF_00535 [Verrucomicrobiaceae bacterium]